MEEERRKKDLAAAKRAAAVKTKSKSPKSPTATNPGTPVSAFQAKWGVQFPRPYAAFLETWTGGIITDSRRVEWRLYSLAELSNPFPESQQAKGLMNFQSMRFFANLARKFTGDDGLPVPGTDRYLLPEELAAALCVGEINGDPLFFDPENPNRLLVLYHDGMDLAVVTDDFNDWLKRNRG
jgi:hypothetical protein